MSCSLQLQRNTKIFYSTIDINNSGGTPPAISNITPSNTWEIEVLAGYAASQAAATQDIQSFESGSAPDRSTTRFNTSINPVDWNFTSYLRPTGQNSSDTNNFGGVASSNAKPVADWYLWQALISNASPAILTDENSAWQNGGRFTTQERAETTNTAAHASNFGEIQEHNLYIKMDNVFYQVTGASVNQAEVDAAIDNIATTAWTGFGRSIVELTGVNRNTAVAVFGGTDNNGTSITANSTAIDLNAIGSFHPYSTMNVGGVTTTADFIKNRLSSIDLNHQPSGSANVNYVFPLTALTWTWNNNVTFLTPETLSALNSPIGNFAGSREISGTFSAYLKSGSGSSSQFLRNVVSDPRTSHSEFANANIIVGTNTTGPYMSFYMPSIQFNFPTHDIADIISINGEFQAQEPATSCGTGGEVDIFAKKA